MQKGWGKAGLLAMCIIATVVAFKMLSSQAENDELYLPIGDSAEARAQIDALWESLSRPAPDYDTLRGFLRSGNHSKAEDYIDRYQKLIEEDITWDTEYVSFLRGVSAGKGFLLSDLDRWVEESGSGYAYMVRAFYYDQAAWLARGTGFARDVPADQMETFHRLLKLSTDDALAGITINDRLLPLYSILVSSTRARDVSHDERKYLDLAIEKFPGAFSVRNDYLNRISPQWGGTLEGYEQFAIEAAAYADQNPRLWIMHGYGDADRGRQFMRSGDFSECAYFYSRALQYGAHGVSLQNRAYCLYKMGWYREALEDIKVSLAIEETSYRVGLKAKIEGNL